jgi:hypothetical protein
MLVNNSEQNFITRYLLVGSRKGNILKYQCGVMTGNANQRFARGFMCSIKISKFSKHRYQI